MKKLVSTLVTSVLLFTSVPAFAEHDYRWGVDHNRYSPYYGRNYGYDYGRHSHRDRGGVSTGAAVAIGLGALILGAAVANGNRRDRDTTVETYPSRRQVCQDIVQNDYYGNPYVAGRKCWYE